MLRTTGCSKMATETHKIDSRINASHGNRKKKWRSFRCILRELASGKLIFSTGTIAPVETDSYADRTAMPGCREMAAETRKTAGCRTGSPRQRSQEKRWCLTSMSRTPSRSGWEGSRLTGSSQLGFRLKANCDNSLEGEEMDHLDVLRTDQSNLQ